MTAQDVISVNLEHDRGFTWHSATGATTTVWTKGFGFTRDAYLSGQALAEWVAGSLVSVPLSECRDWLQRCVSDLDGSFALAVRGPNWIFAAVDRIRGLPLFYGLQNGRFYLSDSAPLVKGQVGDREADALTVQEFLLTGYVTGADTLFPNVKQLQASECLWCAVAGGVPHLETHEYYCWLPGDYLDGTPEELCQAMDEILIRVFERLLQATKGRTMVIPLSGGLDSRLIVTMLRRLGRENVICFSYGRPGNRESAVSERVAKALGYPWLFVPYSNARWRQWWRSDELQSYGTYADGLASLPHTQDWPAVWELERTHAIPADAVFVPGHTITSVTCQANEVHLLSRSGRLAGMPLFTQAVRSMHYSLRKCSDADFSALCNTKCGQALQGVPLDTESAVVSVLDWWSRRERQAKFIVNSVRVYEFWGYEWRVPLFLNEQLEFWRRIPPCHRVHRSLYAHCLAARFQAFGIDFGRCGRQASHWVTAAVPLAHRLGLYPLAAAAYSGLNFLRDYWRNPLASWGIHSPLCHLAMTFQVLRGKYDGTRNSVGTERMLQRLGIKKSG